VALVLLSAILIIGSSVLVSEQNQIQTGGTTSPQSSSGLLNTAAQSIEKNATLALLGNLAGILKGGAVVNPNLTGLDKGVDTSVASYINTNFPMSLPASGSMPACRNAVVEDPYVVCVQSWWVHVTFPTLHAEGLYPMVLSSGASSSNLPSAQNMELSQTPVSRTPYPAAVGSLQLMTYENTSGVIDQSTFPFVESPQTAIGQLESSANFYAASLTGPSSEFSRLAQYILTTMAEIKALEGVAGGPYGTASSMSDVVDKTDASYAGNLALLLTTLRAFRSYDPSALSKFPAGAGISGQLSTLVNNYVTNGTIDGATLFLYLEKGLGNDLTSGAIAQVGATLAQSIYSFTDRFTYDILHTYFGNYVVDPTLLEPVATWQDIWSQGTSAVEQWAMARVNQYLNDYATWLGAVICHPPGGGNPPGQVSGTCVQSNINAQSATANANPIQGTGTVYCWIYVGTGVQLLTWQGTYTLLPSTQLQVKLQAGNPIESYLIGNENQGSNAYAPNPFTFNTKLTIQASQYSNGNDGDSTTSHTFKYQLVDTSFLGEYAGHAGYSGSNPGNVTITTIIKDLSQVTADQNPNPSQSGYVDTIARAMAQIGSSASGLPSLAPSDVVNSSYSYLTQGTNTLYSTDGNGPTQFQSQEPSNVNQWWINGAEHPSLIGSGPSFGSANSLTDIARLAARLWYQTYYNLYYGMQGSITPYYVFGQSSAEDGLWTSPGTTQGGQGPFSGSEPNFGQDIQMADFNDVMQWIESTTSWDNINYYDPTTYWAITSGFCDAGIFYEEPYFDAMTYFDPQIIWDWIMPLVQNSGSGAGDQTVGQWNPQYNDIADSWNNIDSATGGANWGSAPFSNSPGDWLQTHIANPEIMPDTNSMASQWIPNIYQASQQWTKNMAGEQSLPFTPYLQRNMPYDYWHGTLSGAMADGSVETTPGLKVSSLTPLDPQGNGGSPTVVVDPPQVTVHLVDPQDRTTSMSIAPFETTWNVLIAGQVKVTLTDPNPELFSQGKMNPTVVTVEMPFRASFPVTVVTPWPLQDTKPAVSLNPVPLETRGLLGLVVGHPATVSYDYKTLGSSPATWVFLPGDYVSPELDKLLLDLHDASILGKNETAIEAGLLSDLPDRAANGGPALSTALSQDSNLTGRAYSSVAKKASSMTSLMGSIAGKLTLTGGGKLSPVLAINFNTFFGDNMTSLNLQTYYANFQTGEGGTSTQARSDVLEATDSISGSSIMATVVYDPGNVNMTFQSAWKTSGPSFTLSGSWKEGGVVSDLHLQGPAKPVSAQLAAQTPYLTGLLVPGAGYSARSADMYVGGFPGNILSSQSAMSKAYTSWMNTPAPTFDTYVTTEQYLAGYLFDCTDLSSSCSVPAKAWEMGTALQNPHGNEWSATGLAYDPSSGLTAKSLSSFLLWEVSANRVLSYSLNESAPDYMALALLAQPEVGQMNAAWMTNTMLSAVYWNSTYGIGPLQPTPKDLSHAPVAFVSPDFAALEADLGGMCDGGSSSAVVLLGGAQGTGYTFQGTFSET
jgi:hypothetical protein